MMQIQSGSPVADLASAQSPDAQEENYGGRFGISTSHANGTVMGGLVLRAPECHRFPNLDATSRLSRMIELGERRR